MKFLLIDFDEKKSDEPIPSLSDILKKSTILALIFTLPALGVFLGIYYSTGNLLVGAVVGFGLHFVALAFSGRISKFVMKVIR